MAEPRATAEGTAKYAARFEGKVAERHFRRWGELLVSSIGLGTYLGSHDGKTDDAYALSVTEAVKLGCNHVDTAINYRCMRSERSVGAALASLFESGHADREEVFVATKGGYVPFEDEPPMNVRSYIQSRYVDSGILHEDELVGGSHALSPRFLADQLRRSLDNLRLDCIDLYYLHNPEVHTSAVPRAGFLARLKEAFEFLEGRVAAGEIASYGVSSWEAFRVGPEARPFISLADLVGIAREAGGDDHHLAAVQIPFNPAMVEGFALACQTVEGRTVAPFDAARALGLQVVTSVPLLQTKLLKSFPPFLAEGLRQYGSNAERAIQFSRSIPGVNTVLVGMCDPLHVAENMTLAHHDPLSESDLYALFE